VRDKEAWCEQLLLLRYTLRMTGMQIAQIDYGLDPIHPDATACFSWANEIERTYPVHPTWKPTAR
jgi:hypothetical protein